MSSRASSFTPTIVALLLMGCSGAPDDAPATRSNPDRANATSQAVPVTQSTIGATPRDASPSPQSSATPRRVMLGDLDLTGVGHDVGDHDAPVILIDFSDFGCPYCAKFANETQPALEREYVRTGKVFFKYVPFVIGMFPNGREAARAAECAGDQGRFRPMHDLLYTHQAEWKKASEPAVAFGAYADSLALDRARFGACYARTLHPRTRRANEVARDIGIRVTPTFLVNGRPIEGALPLADFRRVIDAALLLVNMQK